MMQWATRDGAPTSPLLPLPQKLETVWQSAKKYDHEDMAQPTPAAHGSKARLKAGESAATAPVRLLSSSA